MLDKGVLSIKSTRPPRSLGAGPLTGFARVVVNRPSTLVSIGGFSSRGEDGVGVSPPAASGTAGSGGRTSPCSLAGQ